MKIQSLFGLFVGVVLILSSCATTNEVNGGGVFQKRKYNTGFYWNRGGSSSESASKTVTELIQSDQVAIQNPSAQIKSQNVEQTSVEVNSILSTDERSIASKRESVKTDNDLSFIRGINQSSFEKAIHPIKRMAKLESKMIQKTVAKAKAPGREGDLGYILGIVLIVLLIIIIFSLLRELLYDIFPFLGPILALILLIFLIVLLLRWLGIM
jgi:hypothetical protein